MNVICLEEEAFYALIEKVVRRMEQSRAKEKKQWLTGEEVMSKLHIGAAKIPRPGPHPVFAT